MRKALKRLAKGRLANDPTALRGFAATGGNGAVTCAASGLPAGLVLDADGTERCPDAEPGEVCGTPTTLTSGAQTVAVTAQDADANQTASDRDRLTFRVSVLARPTLAGLSVGGVSGGAARQGSRRREMVCSRLPAVQAARQVAKR